jgi:hypothetical protein
MSIIENMSNLLAWSLFGLMVCIALLITLLAYWLTR